MKKIALLLFALTILFSTNIYAQFDKPVFQLSVGLSEPMDQLKGDNFIKRYTAVDGNNNTYSFDAPDSNLFKDNLGGRTGFSFYGSAKINFDKYSIVRGVGFVGFNSFNAFETTKTGTQVRQLGGQFVPVPVRYDYSVSVVSFGFGLEIAPTSFTNLFSPFFGANLTFNSFSTSLDRIEGSRTDTNRFSANSFRIGANFNGGIEARFSPQIGLALGVQYNLGNLLLKQSPNLSVTDDLYEWGRTNSTLYDGAGGYYSYLSNSLADANGKVFQSQDQKWNWANFYLSMNFYPNMTGPKR